MMRKIICFITQPFFSLSYNFRVQNLLGHSVFSRGRQDPHIWWILSLYCSRGFNKAIFWTDMTCLGFRISLNSSFMMQPMQQWFMTEHWQDHWYSYFYYRSYLKYDHIMKSFVAITQSEIILFTGFEGTIPTF